LKFWELFITAINISPLDGDGMPSISMISEIGKDFQVEMDSKTFWSCVVVSLSRIREQVQMERKKEMAKHKITSKGKHGRI